MLFLNQRKRKNGRRNIFMPKSSRKDNPDARIDHGASRFPSDIALGEVIKFCCILLEIMDCALNRANSEMIFSEMILHCDQRCRIHEKNFTMMKKHVW